MSNDKILCKVAIYIENKEKWYYAKITDDEMRQISSHIQKSEYVESEIISVDGDKIPINSIVKFSLV